jgi:TolB-like protein
MNNICSSGLVVLTVLLQSFAADTWTTLGRDAEFPTELYFVGIGASERSQDAAKQASMVEIRKQISVKINATTLDEQISNIAGGMETYSNKVESRSRLSTSGEIQGIQVVKTAQQGKIFYALAVLEKELFIKKTRADIADLNSRIIALVEGTRTDINAANMGQALQKLSEAKKLISKVAAQRTLLSAASAPVEADKPAYTVTDINTMYEKCVASLRTTKTSGDGQSFPVGMVPQEPFVVSVTALGTVPVAMIPVAIMQGTKKLAEKYTDDKGMAEFYVGSQADISAGNHTCFAAITLPVSSVNKKYLFAQNQDFAYTVISNPCAANIQIEMTADLAKDRNVISEKLIDRLSKFDIKNDPDAPATVKVSLSAKDAGGVTGISENNSFVKTELTAIFTVLNDDGKQLASFTGSSKGMGGSFAKSVSAGIDNLKIEKDIRPALDQICGAASTPKKKIAVFEFKNRGWYSNWYDISIQMSDMIITKLINSGKFEVVERSQLDKIMEEKVLAQSGVVEETEAMQAARLAGADLLLIGSAGISGAKIEVDARIIDANSGTAKCAMSTSSYSLLNLRALADDIVGQIKGKCGR